jgi:hypothetical protein
MLYKDNFVLAVLNKVWGWGLKWPFNKYLNLPKVRLMPKYNKNVLCSLNTQ